ncbi:MAG: MFS transporter [Gammaproteobacteria bacterium]|nr:MFS transporter [Gammaproteobacteria bacterium]MBT7878163.1 MFS transporter [Gammaproteobacteria bacterium]MDG1231938.1 MFS transporter [Pseudomonadales bacterium]
MIVFSSSAGDLTLSDSKQLRFLTVFVFYLNQGIGLGLFGFVIPAWLTANGASLSEIATIVGLSALPWSLKFISGAIVDRYTFLPMGRRRIWIIGAQSLLVLCLIGIAVLSPSAEEIALLAVIGFVLNLAVVFQDVGVDALAIDLFQEDERPTAAGTMFGAQSIGGAMSVGLAGWLLDAYGLPPAALAMAVLPIATILFGLTVREREGERKLPWSIGEPHPVNIDLQVTNWRELLITALRSIMLTGSLMLMPLLLIRSIPAGVSGTFGPTLFSEYAGWSMTDFTNFVALVSFALAIYTMLFAWKIVRIFGERNVIAWSCGSACILSLGFGSLPALWSEAWFLVNFVILTELLAITAFIAIIPICMRLCCPVVAGTQFVIYMGIANLGAPIGAYLTTVTAGAGHEQLLFWLLGSLFAAAYCWSLWAQPVYLYTDDDEVAGGTQHAGLT